MKKLLALLVLSFVAVSVSTSAPSRADVGNCYSPRPLCIGLTKLACVCDIMSNCFWACR